MKQQPFQKMLRSAVIAAIPLATQVGCAATEAKSSTNTTPPKIENNDPCRNSGEITRKSAQERYSYQTSLLEKAPDAEACLAMCKQAFMRGRIGGTNDLFKLESLTVNNCKTENRPYTNVVPGGQMPTPSTLVSCDVDYIALHSPYTCPRPVVGRIPHGMHMEAQAADNPNSIGEYLADMAAMETAAITAFLYLSRELEAYGAPADLVKRAREAAVEETRHAEMAGLLSAAYETNVPEVKIDDFVLRSLREIALENAGRRLCE